ncbi:Homeobox protein vex1 [Turdus rufiventris]|nr:Homeobox protein vex1 [Turdus rufiventris]
MEKGPFSVEWLAQSSRGGGAREMPESPRDREAAERRSPGHGAGSESSGRSRTKFSAAQLQELERSFREQRYIGAGEKRRLAAVLNLSQSQGVLLIWKMDKAFGS